MNNLSLPQQLEANVKGAISVKPMHYDKIHLNQRGYLTPYQNTKDWSLKRIRAYLTKQIRSGNHFKAMYYDLYNRTDQLNKERLEGEYNDMYNELIRINSKKKGFIEFKESWVKKIPVYWLLNNNWKKYQPTTIDANDDFPF